jgi:glycosyltransferase involved in cell wall biosynthesis
MKLAIVIPTYQRPDGKTKEYLIRTLNSIQFQTHKDYHIYLIGDKYDDDNEFREISSRYEKITAVNLPIAVERSKYPHGDYRLYCAGGGNAYQTGVSMALEDGYDYVCFTCHDDWWESNHLELISKVIDELNPLFITTVSSFINGSHLPIVELTGKVIPHIPLPGYVCTSSTCIKYSDTKLRARDCFAETGTAIPGDAELWIRLAKEMRELDKKGYLISTLTCHHDEDGYSRGL